MLNSIVPTLFLCFLFVRQKIKLAVLQWEWWSSDYSYVPKATWAFSLGPQPIPRDCPLPPHDPTTERPPRCSSLLSSNRWRVELTWRKSIMPGLQQEWAEKGLTKLEYNLHSHLARGNRARKNSVNRDDAFPPEVINSNLCREKIESAGRIFPHSDLCCVRLEWGLYCSLR